MTHHVHNANISGNFLIAMMMKEKIMIKKRIIKHKEIIKKKKIIFQ